MGRRESTNCGFIARWFGVRMAAGSVVRTRFPGDFLVDSVWELGVVYLFRAAVEAESRRLERMLRAREFVYRVTMVGRYGYVWSVDAGRDGVDGVVFHRRFGHRHRERFQIHRRRSSVRFAKFTRRIWG